MAFLLYSIAGLAAIRLLASTIYLITVRRALEAGLTVQWLFQG